MNWKPWLEPKTQLAILLILFVLPEFVFGIIPILFGQTAYGFFAQVFDWKSPYVPEWFGWAGTYAWVYLQPFLMLTRVFHNSATGPIEIHSIGSFIYSCILVLFLNRILNWTRTSLAVQKPATATRF